MFALILALMSFAHPLGPKTERPKPAPEECSAKYAPKKGATPDGVKAGGAKGIVVGTCAQGKAETDSTCTDAEGKLACFSGTGKLRTPWTCAPTGSTITCTCTCPN